MPGKKVKENYKDLFWISDLGMESAAQCLLHSKNLSDESKAYAIYEIINCMLKARH